MKKLEFLILGLFSTFSMIEVMIKVSRDEKHKIYGGLENKEEERIKEWTQLWKGQEIWAEKVDDEANSIEVDVAKRAGWVGPIGFAGQTGRESKQVIFKRVNRVAGRIGLTVFFKQIFFFSITKTNQWQPVEREWIKSIKQMNCT